jgi:hypothetical protein
LKDIVKKKMSVEGIEPSTNGLKGHCSAIELHAHNQAGKILPLNSFNVNEVEVGKKITPSSLDGSTRGGYHLRRQENP